MPPTQGTTDEVSSKKQYTVTRSAVGINSVNSNVITIDSSHKLLNGETVRIQSILEKFLMVLSMMLFTLRSHLVQELVLTTN